MLEKCLTLGRFTEAQAMNYPSFLNNYMLY